MDFFLQDKKKVKASTKIYPEKSTISAHENVVFDSKYDSTAGDASL